MRKLIAFGLMVAGSTLMWPGILIMLPGLGLALLGVCILMKEDHEKEVSDPGSQDEG